MIERDSSGRIIDRIKAWELAHQRGVEDAIAGRDDWPSRWTLNEDDVIKSYILGFDTYMLGLKSVTINKGSDPIGC